MNRLFRLAITATAVLTLFILASCEGQNSYSKDNSEVIGKTAADLKDFEVAYFASGCFWCVEAVYESVKGVEEAISGYSGGNPNEKPAYGKQGSGSEAHAEAVAVYYDPKIVSFETLVKVYLNSMNPTVNTGQGPDHGPYYRTIAFYRNGKEKAIIESVFDAFNKTGEYDKPVNAEIKQFTKFYRAEEYHQNFEKRNPNQGYVKAVSIPRLKRFQKRMPEVLKDGAMVD